MKKRKKGRKLGRKKDQRKALVKALVSALFLHEKIKGTEGKLKEISRFAEKFITISKKGDLSSRRRLGQFFSPKIVKKLIDEIGPRYKERQGGYTRIIKLGQRNTDCANTAIIELVK